MEEKEQFGLEVDHEIILGVLILRGFELLKRSQGGVQVDIPVVGPH